MRPGMRADGMALLGDFLYDVEVLASHFPDHEECGAGALGGKRSQDRPSGAGHRTVVESENHFARRQEIAIAMWSTEPGTSASIDLHDPRDAKRVGVRTSLAYFGRGGHRCH